MLPKPIRLGQHQKVWVTLKFVKLNPQSIQRLLLSCSRKKCKKLLNFLPYKTNRFSWSFQFRLNRILRHFCPGANSPSCLALRAWQHLLHQSLQWGCSTPLVTVTPHVRDWWRQMLVLISGQTGRWKAMAKSSHLRASSLSFTIVLLQVFEICECSSNWFKFSCKFLQQLQITAMLFLQ